MNRAKQLMHVALALGGALIAGPSFASEPSWKTLWIRNGTVQQVRILKEWGNGRKIYESRFAGRPDDVRTVELNCSKGEYRVIGGKYYDYKVYKHGYQEAMKWHDVNRYRTQSQICDGVEFKAYD